MAKTKGLDRKNRRRRSSFKTYQNPRTFYTSLKGGAGTFLDDVLCLTHGTSLEFFEMMLDENRIKARPGDSPIPVMGFQEVLNKGAFTSLVLKCNVGNSINPLCANDVILVLSKDLLTKQPYHISNNWIGGMQFAPLVPEKTRPIRTYGDVLSYVQDNSEVLCKGSHLKNELVFDQDISLDDLVEVWICNLSTMEKRINTEQPDGSFRRVFTTVEFNPSDMQDRVYQLLKARGKPHIPVKIIDIIPDIKSPDGGGKPKRRKIRRSSKVRSRRLR